MSAGSEESLITERLQERPSLQLGKARGVGTKELAYRFLAGALTSVVAGTLTLVFGAGVGGIMLAFPAILAASLTLIERQEDSAEAREDARGAVAGGFALAAFAAVCALWFGHVSPALVLALATAAWIVTALLIYVVAWFR